MVRPRLSTSLFSIFILLTVVTAPTLAYDAASRQTRTTAQPSDGGALLVADVQSLSPAAVAPTNNSSMVQHENPESVDEGGNAAALQQWFAQRIRSYIERSSANLSQGDYEMARTLLGEEYNDTVEKYADLAEQTETNEDDEVATRLQNTTESHRQYVSTVETYRQTRTAYQRAKQNENETRAQKLARELEQLATQINRTGSTLTRNYKTIANETDSNLTQIQHSITNTTTNVSSQQTPIRRTEFKRTTLTVNRYTTNISFRNPLVVNGTLATANGTQLGNRTVVVRLGRQTVRTTTTANGSFSLVVRPTLLHRGVQQISVHYLPQATSVYLDAQTALTVNVTATTPKITLTRHPASGKYNDSLVISGTVHVPNVATGVNDVPVRIMVGSETLGTTRTTVNGSFTLTASLPSSVRTGEQQLRVVVPLTGRALTPATAVTSLSVRPTPTQLTVSTNPTATASPNSTQVRGQLRAGNGTPLPNQSITIRVDGRAITTTVTNERGAYATTLNISALRGATNATSSNVTAVFTGSGNLERSQAVTAVQVRSSSGPLSDLPVPPAVLGTGLLGLGALGALALRDFGLGGRGPSADSANDTIADTASAANKSETTSSTMAGSQSILEQARTEVKAGNDDTAMKLAYMAVRHHLTTHVDGLADTGSQTHWEFYNTSQNLEDVTPVRVSDLESLTEAFERAQFTMGELSPTRATEAVEIATTVLSSTNSGT